MLREELEKLLASEESECQYMIVKSKKRADCWKQFGEVVAKSDLSAVRLEPDSIAVACLSCQQVYAYHHTRTGSSSLNRHICSKPESSAQQDIRSMIKSSSSNSRVTTQQKKTMTSMLALMCCTDLRPFQIVEGAGFRSVIQQALNIGVASKFALEADDVLCHRTTISRHIDSMAESKRQLLKERLANHFSDDVFAAFTLDLWTDDYRKFCYLSVTVHFVNEVFQLEARTLSVKRFEEQSHTAVLVLSAFRSVLESFMCVDPTRCVVVSDNGSNMAGSEGISSIYQRLPCSDHKLATVVTRVLNKANRTIDGNRCAPYYRFIDKIPSILELIENCKSLVAYVKHAEIQEELSHSLKQENMTRWIVLLEFRRV